MATFTQLVGRVRQQLMGYAAHQESVSELAMSMTDSDVTFQVEQDTLADLSRGLVEIDDELIWVKGYDEASGVVTVMGGANGRGADGTTAASHTAAALITSGPAYPRARIKEALNDAIRGLYPSLVVLGTTDFPFNAAQLEYELPAEATGLWHVTARMVGPEKYAPRLERVQFNSRALTDDFPTGKSVQLFTPVTPGQTVQVVYTKAPSVLVNSSDDFAAVSGYPDRITDLVVYGAALRMLSPLEAARLQMQAVEASERAPLVPPKSAANAVQLLSALYSQRLAEEQQRQYEDSPTYMTLGG